MTGDRVSKRRPYFETNTYVLVGSIGNAETVFSTQTTEQNRTLFIVFHNTAYHIYNNACIIKYIYTI